MHELKIEQIQEVNGAAVPLVLIGISKAVSGVGTVVGGLALLSEAYDYFAN